VSALRDPAEGAAAVDAYARAEGATVRVPETGETRMVGDLRISVVGPITPPIAAEGPNNASLVLLVEVSGLRLLVTGDIVPDTGETRMCADLRISVVGPITPPVAAEGPNNASLVLLVEVSGLRLLLTGDIEPESQRRLARAVGSLHVDVVKVPHHGSRYQDLP